MKEQVVRSYVKKKGKDMMAMAQSLINKRQNIQVKDKKWAANNIQSSKTRLI